MLQYWYSKSCKDLDGVTFVLQLVPYYFRSKQRNVEHLTYLAIMADVAITTQETAKRVYGTPFLPGNGGRPPGVKNKLSKTVRESVLETFNKLQEDPEFNLEAFAKKDLSEFYRIAAKLIPTEITGSIKQIIVVTDGDE